MEHESEQGTAGVGDVPPFDHDAFQDRWRIFLIRRALVVHQRLGQISAFVTFEIPALPELIASLLYVDLASLLEEGVSSQMSRTRFKELEDLEARIEHLAANGRVLDRD